MKNQKVLIVLGSPNSPTGELSEISKSRLNYSLHDFQKGNRILCTGGWGPHFNTATHAHASYSKAYLMEQGLEENDFLAFALSSNTVDDAVKIKPIIAKFKKPLLTIITSDYHLNRVQLIFNEILKNQQLEFIGVQSNLDKETYKALVAHEKKAVSSILKKGLYY